MTKNNNHNNLCARRASFFIVFVISFAFNWCHFRVFCFNFVSYFSSLSLLIFNWLLWMIVLRFAMLQQNWCEYGAICLLLSSWHCSRLLSLGLCLVFSVYPWSVVWSWSLNENVSQSFCLRMVLFHSNLIFSVNFQFQQTHHSFDFLSNDTSNMD